MIVLRLNPGVNARPDDFTGTQSGAAFLSRRLQPMTGLRTVRLADANPDRPPSVPHRLEIETGLQPETKLPRNQEKYSSRLQISDARWKGLGHLSSKMHSAKTSVCPPSVQELYSLQNEDWDARYVPSEPRTPSNAGVLLRASRFRLFDLVLKAGNSRPGSNRSGQISLYWGQVCRRRWRSEVTDVDLATPTVKGDASDFCRDEAVRQN